VVTKEREREIRRDDRKRKASAKIMRNVWNGEKREPNKTRSEAGEERE
jgi:hypothetical protein